MSRAGLRMLFCTDGSVQAENAIRFGSIIAAACQAEATILGIAETSGDEPALLQALTHGQRLLKDKALGVEIISKTGEPIEEIVKRTTEIRYDLVVIGAVRKGAAGPFCMSAKAYKIIKLIVPPVLTVIGSRAKLENILICSGGREYIDKALELSGKIARGARAQVTLLHVMAQPPGMYGGLLGREENVELLLQSSLPLGQNLKREKQTLDAIGVSTQVRLRHGEVMRELLSEMHGDYDLVVTGSAPARGPLQSYVMGDITREIVNRAERPVLVIRTGQSPEGLGRLVAEIKQAFGRQ